MTLPGINSGFLLITVFNLAILLGWPLLSLLALFSLRGRGLTGTTLALWVLISVGMPFLGALAVWIVQPKDGPKDVEAGPRAT
jgi:hypothetical protein